MRRQCGPESIQTGPSTHPEITSILSDLIGHFVKGVSPNCKNLINFGTPLQSPVAGGR